MRSRRGLGAAAALCLSLISSAWLARIPAYAADLTAQGMTAWSDPQPRWVHVMGEVVNSGTVSYRPGQVTCTLTDAGGTLLTESTPVEANILLSGEKAPFDDIFLTGPGYHSPSCSATGAPTSIQPDHNFTAVITDVTRSPDGAQHVIGTLTNLNTVAESHIKVVLTSYDPANTATVIDEGVAWVDGPVVANGGTATFDLNANPTRHWDATPADSATLSEAPSPAVVLSTEAIAFSDQVQGTVSAEQVLYVRNIGTGSLTFTNIPTFGGTNPADFGLAADDFCSGMTVAPGAACSMGITFTPQAAGSRRATLTINDNANGSPSLVTLSGNGLARPSIALSASSVDFGPRTVGTTGQTVIKLTSDGLDPVSISSIRVDDTTDFGVDGAACLVSALSPGSTCQISVAFHPQVDGPLTATATIRSNARQDPVAIPLAGSGTHAVPSATLSTNHVDFGAQMVGTTSPSQTVTLTNSGIGSLNISGIAPSGDFGQTTTCGSTLSTGSSCSIAVTFEPTATGTRLGTVTITDNAGSGAQTVSLTGSGTTETDFYFAEGFTGPGFKETLSLLMPSNDGTATVDYFLNGAAPITSQVDLVRGQAKTVSVNDAVGPGKEVSIRVKLPFPGVAERIMHFQLGAWHGSTDIVGVTHTSPEWDFAEGSTLGFFSEYLTLQNPNVSPVLVDLHYFTDSTSPVTKTVTLPPTSRTTIPVFVGNATANSACDPSATCGIGPGYAGVSIQAIAQNGKQIIAERPFYVNGFSFGSGAIRDGHVAFGATAPATTWNFAEGTTLPGFNEYLTLENPGGTGATVTLTYIDDQGVMAARSLTVRANTRSTVQVFDAGLGVGPGHAGVSVQVTSTAPIVAERPMYMVHDFGSGPVAGATVVVGSTLLSNLFGFASASTVPGENDFLTIQNPSATTAAAVHITYYSPTQTITRDLTVNANTRLTVPVFGSATVGGIGSVITIAGIVVLSTQPVLVEKPTYSSNAATYGATDTLGYSPPSF